MATQLSYDDQDDEVLDLTEETFDEPDQQDDDGGDANEADEGDDDADVVVFADEVDKEPEAESDLVKHLRETIRDRNKALADARKAAPVAAEPDIIVGDRPTSDNWDFEQYGTFDEAFDAWDERRTQAAAQKARRDDAQRAANDAWGEVVKGHQTKVTALRYPDRDAAITTATDALSGTAQALIAKHADNSALFLYAVGKSPAKLAELERVDVAGDPFAVVKAITKMEATLTTTKRSGPRPPNPDTPVRGGRPISAGGSEKKLKELEDKARKTGDRTALIAFKQSLGDKK